MASFQTNPYQTYAPAPPSFFSTPSPMPTRPGDICLPCKRAATSHTRFQCQSPNGSDRRHSAFSNPGPCGCKMAEEGVDPASLQSPMFASSQFGASLPHPLSVANAPTNLPPLASLYGPNASPTPSSNHYTAASIRMQPGLSNLSQAQAEAAAADANARLDAANAAANEQALLSYGFDASVIGSTSPANPAPHAGYTSSTPVIPAPPPPPRNTAAIEGFEIEDHHVVGYNTNGTFGTWTVTRATFDTLLTAAYRTPGASIRHLDFIYNFPASMVPGVGYELLIAVAPAGSAQPSRMQALRNFPGAVSRVAGNLTPHQIVLPAVNTLRDDLRVYWGYSAYGFDPALDAATGANLGEVRVEVGAI